MQEKATISRLENIVGWIGSIILSIGLFLAAFLLVMDIVQADSIPNDVINDFKSELDNYTNANQTQIDECINYLSNYQYFYWIKTVSGSSSRHQEIFVAYNDSDLMFRLNTNDTTNNRIVDIIRTRGIMTYGTKSSVEAYIIYLNEASNNILTTIWSSSTTNGNYTNDRHTYNLQNQSPFNDISNASSTSLPTSMLSPLNECTVLYNNDTYMYSLSGSSSQNIGTFKKLSEFTNTTIYTPPNNTAGFDCYKLDTKGGIYFVADYSSLITFDHSTTNTSSFSCDVHLDDTIQTITLDSTSEYFIYDVDHRQAEYSFPITAFVPDYTEYEHVWIDNVLVVNTYSGHGGSVNSTFAFITPIDILGSFPEEELTPTIIPQVSPVPDNLEGYGIDYHSGEELKTLYDNNMFNQWITESEFYSDIAQLGGGRSVKLVGATDQNIYENNTDNTLAYLSNVAAILSGTADVPGTGAVMTVVYGVNAFFDTISAPRNNGQIDFNGAAEGYIKDNLYSSTYDIIILEAYYDAEALQTNSNDLLYTPIPSIDDLHAGEPYVGKIFYVILTQRYIESLNLDGLGSMQKLLESDVYYAKATYEYLYDRLNDFENKSLEGIKDILGIDNQIFDRLGNIDTYIQRIESLLKKILDAILNLNIQPIDTTAIENKLDDIYTRLGNSNLNSDWYKRYREWLYDETNDNVLNTPHEYMLNTFDDVKALFDVFAYFDIPQTGFWSSAREYLNRMNGNTYNDNINDYLVTGISSQNFYKDNCNTLVWSDIE